MQKIDEKLIAFLVAVIGLAIFSLRSKYDRKKLTSAPNKKLVIVAVCTALIGIALMFISRFQVN